MTYYDRGEIWTWTPTGPQFLRMAFAHEGPRQFARKSPDQYAPICTTCRINRKCGFYGHKIYRVGWKFECPKKTDKKQWMRIQQVLENYDRKDHSTKDKIILDRAFTYIVEPYSEGDLFPAAELYKDSEIKRKKHPRHKKTQAVLNQLWRLQLD